MTMQNGYDDSEQGSGILMVLGILAMVLTLAMVFAMTSRNDRAVAMATSKSNRESRIAFNAVERSLNMLRMMYAEQQEPPAVTPSYSAKEPVSVLYNYPVEEVFTEDMGRARVTKDSQIQNVWFTKVKDGMTTSENHPNVSGTSVSSFYAALVRYSKYGRLLDENGGDFRTLLGTAADFQYVGTSNNYSSRFGYVIIPEGNRMNLNAMVQSSVFWSGSDGTARVEHIPVSLVRKMEYFDSAVEPKYTAKQVTDAENNIIDEATSFPIYGYSEGEDGSYALLTSGSSGGSNTALHYGVHPRELLPSNSPYIGYFTANADSRRGFRNFEQMAGSNENVSGQLKNDIFRYTLAGTNDLEIPDSSYEIRENLQMAGDKSWEEFSAETRADSADVNSLLGGLPGYSSWQFTNASNEDVSRQVWANIADFSDSDDYVTHNVMEKSPSVKFLNCNTTLDNLPDDDAAEYVCGNEIAPAVVGISFRTYCSGKVKNTFPNDQTVDVENKWQLVEDNLPSIHIGDVQLATANFFNEDLADYGCRIIIRGNATLAYGGAVAHEEEQTDSVGETTKVSLNHAKFYTVTRDASDKTKVNFNEASSTIGAISGTVPAFSDADVDNIKTEMKKDSPFVFDSGIVDLPHLNALKKGVDGENKAFSIDLDALGISSVILSDNDTDTVHDGFIRNMFYDVQVKSVIVMVFLKDTSADASGLVDLVYLKGLYDEAEEHYHDKGYNSDIDADTKVSGFQDSTTSSVGWNSQCQAGAFCRLGAQDPRCNLNACYWTVLSDFVRTAPANDLMEDCMAEIENTLKQECNSADYDPEPELNLTASADAITTTYSTAYIANHPITSFWQLGAVSRGEPGMTINLKAYNRDITGYRYYADGDANLMELFALSTLCRHPDGGLNPNCFSQSAFVKSGLLNNIPYDSDPNNADVYEPLQSYSGDCRNVTDAISSQCEIHVDENFAYAGVFPEAESNVLSDSDDVKKEGLAEKSALLSLYGFLSSDVVDLGTKSTDRTQESLYACMAPLLSTRSESFTILAAGQALEKVGELDDAAYDANPDYFIKRGILKVASDDYYRPGMMHLVIATVVRDCFSGKLKVVNKMQIR